MTGKKPLELSAQDERALGIKDGPPNGTRRDGIPLDDRARMENLIEEALKNTKFGTTEGLKPKDKKAYGLDDKIPPETRGDGLPASDYRVKNKVNDDMSPEDQRRASETQRMERAIRQAQEANCKGAMDTSQCRDVVKNAVLGQFERESRGR